MAENTKNTMSLRNLSRKMPGVLEINKVINELDKFSERELVILGVACIDDALTLALKIKLIDLKPEDDEQLFEKPGAALSTLSSKILLAFALGLISEEMREDLDCLRGIRNACAHSSFVFSVEKQEAIIRKLRCIKTIDRVMDETERLKGIHDLTVSHDDSGGFTTEEGEWMSLSKHIWIMDKNGLIAAYVPEPIIGKCTTKERLISSIQVIWFLLMVIGLPKFLSATPD
jgi:hypothetical protein